MKRSHVPERRQNDWGSPLEVFRHWNKSYHFCGDIAASDQNHLHEKYITREENALSLNWSIHFNPYGTTRLLTRKEVTGKVPLSETEPLPKFPYKIPFAWLNPPFNPQNGTSLEDWIKKAAVECDRGLGIVMLLPYQGALYWEELVFKAASLVYFIPGRLAFRDPETNKEQNNCKFGCAIVVFDPSTLPGAKIDWISQREMGIRKRQR